MYNKIVNPKTGRQVNTNSKLGRRILQTFLKQIMGGVKKADQIIDRPEEWPVADIFYVNCVIIYIKNLS